ncbi:hypothetical protein GCM10023080_066270 [Streptomyces pseudoechinosporeus]
MNQCEFGRRHLTEPGQSDAKGLARVAGRILGPGCVVSDRFAPHHERPTAGEKQAGLRLVDADDPGEPETWLVHEALTYRKCAACGRRTAGLPERHVRTEWTPRRTSVRRGRSRYTRELAPVDQGPHAADSPACPTAPPRDSPTTGTSRPGSLTLREGRWSWLGISSSKNRNAHLQD